MNPTEQAAQSRRELGDFLRTRRAHLLPAKAGVAARRRRRVAGLRREEVAELADISVTWYTWLEQGRPVNVSTGTLERLASVFNLVGREREHLFLLAGHMAPPPVPESAQKIMNLVRQVLESMNPNPAYVLNQRWDILGWNRAAARVFGDFGAISEAERNIVWMTFQRDSFFSRLFVDWDRYAHCVLGNFRVDSTAHVNDPGWSSLKQALLRESPEFAEWWPNHEIAAPEAYRKELLHPVAGLLTFEPLHLDVQHPSQLKIVSYLPCLDTDTAARLQKLDTAAPVRKRTRPTPPEQLCSR
ncbi:helix-turn-helix transcriptional regulator [uncultured Paludibaculum sp.]|uniref:helix-turn-helix transcriptional regulator n=1 Tax=uncultured Paludibaculum sp. TaxID=1765020 RepID=UPI002AABACCF|nr:helix-turn-helix transcriptional regulator [uncultured Paludibaculum sp.]